jgi:enoyl-CoA hydratase
MATSNDPVPATDSVFSTIRLERPTGAEGVPLDGIRILTLDRPERLNAMSFTLIEELHDALDELAADRRARVLILTGEGRGFCSGLDLVDIDPTGGPETSDDGSPRRGRVQGAMELQERIASLVPKMRRLPVPVIAAVNGAAAGGGLALALASDVRLAGRTARFNVAFVRIGLSGCDIGVSWLLPRWIGASRAFELMLTGRIVEADEADRIGLVTRVVDDAELMDAAIATAQLICANSPMGIRMTKEVMWSNLETGSLRAGIDLENRTQILTSFTEDTGEAITAFMERRPPNYRNR